MIAPFLPVFLVAFEPLLTFRFPRLGRVGAAATVPDVVFASGTAALRSSGSIWSACELAALGLCSETALTFLVIAASGCGCSASVSAPAGCRAEAAFVSARIARLRLAADVHALAAVDAFALLLTGAAVFALPLAGAAAKDGFRLAALGASAGAGFSTRARLDARVEVPLRCTLFMAATAAAGGAAAVDPRPPLPPCGRLTGC